MSSKLNERINFDLDELRQMLTEGHDLINASKSIIPNATNRWALGAMLQAFYNGIESIFKQIATKYDGKPAKSQQWHADLLTLMTKATIKRPAVISPELFILLKKHLAFRHLFRSIYTHELHWENMTELVWGSEETLRLCENELRGFMENIQSANPE